MVVIYRKYRPKTFSEVVDQKHIIKTITNAIKTNKISHAYLFYGPRGCGKTTLARLIAKSLNCTNKKTTDFEPCNKCNSCFEINEGNAIDLIEIDAASTRGIDEIRNLKEGINIVPIKSKYKVYIIDEVHQLTKEASNALLKTLEEPPHHAIFVLCTTEYGKIIPTIASRCQRFEFKKLTIPEITEKLNSICKKEGIKIEKDSLELIAKNAEGAIRDAESFLDKIISLGKKQIEKVEAEELLGIVGIGSIKRFVDLLSQKNEKESLIYLHEIFQSGIDIETFTAKLISYLRDLLLFKVSPEIYQQRNIFTKEEEKNLLKQKDIFKESTLVNILKILIDVQNKIKWASLPTLPLEIAVIEIIKIIE